MANLPFLVVQFKYLGIQITYDFNSFLVSKRQPVLTQLSQMWYMLIPPDSGWPGKSDKDDLFAKIPLCFFRNTPVLIPKVVFDKIDQLLTPFIWAGKVPHLAKTTVQLPMSLGGLALPNFKYYYWAAALVTVR